MEKSRISDSRQPFDDAVEEAAAEEAEALSFLAEWINIEGDLGEAEVRMDEAAARIPEKVEEGADALE